MSLISVEEAYARLTQGITAIAGDESVVLRAAYGRILAEDLKSSRSQPGFDASAMDGYAIRAEDAMPPFAALTVIGASAAGGKFSGIVGAGEAVRIFTGAPVPAGADTILIQENAELLDARHIRPLEPVEAGRHIRQTGADFHRDDVLLARGTRLSAGALALAASGNHPSLHVVRKPRVAVLATGDELVLPGAALGGSQIVASNGFGVAAIVEACGGEVLDYGIARDTEADIGARFDQALADLADVFVTIGSASVGDHDLVGKVFADKGVDLDFWKVAMRPGKPLMAGRLGEMRIIGLPGNPASSMVTATLFLAPLVKALAGRREETVYRSGILGADMPPNDMRADFVRARIDRTSAVVPIINPFSRQDSSLLSVYAQSDVLLLRPPHAKAGKAGEPCSYVTLD